MSAPNGAGMVKASRAQRILELKGALVDAARLRDRANETVNAISRELEAVESGRELVPPEPKEEAK